MLGFSLNRVTGMSMHPRLPHNSFILLYSLPSRGSTKFRSTKLKVGDMVKCSHREFGSIIKTIAAIDDQGLFWLKGEHESSVSTQEIGPVHIDLISDKVIFAWSPG